MSNAFAETFLTKKPKEGITIVQARLKDAMALDLELAEYFKERAQIEETYAKSLVKASKRLYIMDPGVLGHFATIWELLLKEFNQVANYHSEMAYKITRDVEEPLRASPSDDYPRLQQLEPTIQSIENKNKLSSVFKKRSSSPKPETEGLIVEYLNLNQCIDQARLNRLKKSVEKFEQIQSDQLMKRVELTNKTLSATELFDIQHDIYDFCAERGKGLIVNLHDSQRSTTNKFKSVFMKKKKQPNQDDHINQEQHALSYCNAIAAAAPPSPPINNVNEASFTLNNAPFIDVEGYSVPTITHFPTMTSDISSDDMDSDYQSMKRLQINIKDDALKEDTIQENDSFNKMASILREHTPTLVTRKARGRRESTVTRSQTDFFIDSNDNSHLRSNSILSISSNETSHSNPFLHIPTTSFTNTFTDSPQQLQDSPVALDPCQLEPILEDQPPHVSFSISEKTSMADKHHVLQVHGKISITYTGSTTTPVQVRLSHMAEGIQHHPHYVTDDYTLNTANFIQGEPTVCFTYQVELNGDGLPIHLSPSWKCVPGITYLIIKHSELMRDFKGSVQVGYDHDVTSVQSTPQGIWDINQKKLTWQMKDVLDEPRLLAKFFLSDDQVGIPQPVFLNYSVKDTLATGLTIHVVDDTGLIKQHLETCFQSENIVLF